MADARKEPAPVPMKTKWFHILLSLADQDLHGTAIVEAVLQRTGGSVRLWPAALYGALGDLSEQGLIEEVDPPADAPTDRGKRRFYGITREGVRALAKEVAEMEALVNEARNKGVREGLQKA